MSNNAFANPIACAQQFGSADLSSIPPAIPKSLRASCTEILRTALTRAGLAIEPIPILWKCLQDKFLRIMFPVSGAKIEPGAVVSIVLLYDLDAQRTLYAHPMYAGPQTNPLLKHPDGPMASPKAQEGADGDRATRRLIEHKRALWKRFCHERDKLGPVQAGMRWRKSYYWALRRLYFCSRCTECQWGTPFFDGPDPETLRKPTHYSTMPVELSLSNPNARILEEILDSDVWQIETRYAQRGGFTVSRSPRLVQQLPCGYLNWVFPTDAAIIQGGSLVALDVLYHPDRGGVCFAHCLSAGPEAEILFMRGDKTMAFPPPQSSQTVQRARQDYADWRKEAWSQFWLDDLEQGPEAASVRWLTDFWKALEKLFGGKRWMENSMTTVCVPTD